MIHRSHVRGDAPLGYVIARVFVAERLFVDAEMNSFTEDNESSFQNASLYVLDDDADEDQRCGTRSVSCIGDLIPEGELAVAFDFVREWYLHPGGEE